MSNKIIIIGAGASHAIDTKYPVMDNFFSVVSFNYDIVLDCSLVRWLSKKYEITDWGLKQLFTRIDAFSGTLDAPQLKLLEGK